MKNKQPREDADIREAFQALSGTTGVKWQLHPCSGLDGLADLTFHKHRVEVGVEFKPHVRRSMLGQLRDSLECAASLHGLPVVLCTDYVGPKLADALREANILFLDKAGNCYLSLECVLLRVQGQPKPAAVRAREKGGRAFQSAGLRLVFALLREPLLADRPYRQLAERVGISLYAVKCAMDDLKAKGFLTQQGKQRRMRQGKRLLDEWSIAYRDRLRPQLVRGMYEAADADWWKSIEMEIFPACWGGEAAAAQIGLMRRPQIHTVYCSGNVNALIAAGRLHRKDNGGVELLDAFWGQADGTLAPELLVYADLVTSGDERSIDAAKELYGN